MKFGLPRRSRPASVKQTRLPARWSAWLADRRKERSNLSPHPFMRNHLLKEVLPEWRVHVVFAVLMLALLILVGRSFYLQVINEEFLQQQGKSRYRREITIPASRGRILDREDTLLAISMPTRTVQLTPPALEEAQIARRKAGEEGKVKRMTPEQIRQLAQLLEVDAAEIEKRLALKVQSELRRQLPLEIAEKVAALRLPGISLENSYSRFYPTGELTAHLVGFVNANDKGVNGAELIFEQALEGRSGQRSVIQDRRHQIVEDIADVKPPKDGEDIRLAIDSKIQYIAYTQLKRAVEENRARRGGVVVLDSRTGEILSLVNWPTYNPNNRPGLPRDDFEQLIRNRAISDTFEPGSTLKPLTAAMALDSSRFRYDSVINCAPGKMTIGSATIGDSHPHGALTIAQIIQKSSNIGSAKLALEFRAQHMWEMFNAVGFGQPVFDNPSFVGETRGLVRPWKQWQRIEQATMSYGHGISVSLVQLAHAYLPFARDGDIVPLSLLRQPKSPVPGKQVFSQQTAREVRAMLEMVVSKEGTAPKAAVPGYRVGGKTGTAYKLQGGEYVKKYIASFVGIGPLSDPRFVVAVILDEPSGDVHYGGDVAGPAFSAIMGGILTHAGLPPDGRVVSPEGGAAAVPPESRPANPQKKPATSQRR